MNEVCFSQAGCRNSGYCLVCDLYPVALVLGQRAPRRLVEPRQQRFPGAIELLVVFREIGIGANLLFALPFRPRAVEGGRNEGGVGLVGRQPHPLPSAK